MPSTAKAPGRIVCSAAAIEAAISQLIADDAGKCLCQINENKHRLLLNGVEVQLLSARVLGLLMRPGTERRLH